MKEGLVPVMKRVIATFLVAALLSALPLTAFAAEDGSVTETSPSVEVLSTDEALSPEDTTADSPVEEPTEDSEETSPDGEEIPSDPEEGTETPEEQPLFGMHLQDHVSYVSGNGDMVYPADNLRRSEAASLIYQLLTDPSAPVGGNFTDVSSGAWYQKFVDSLTEMGILSGMGDGLFMPQSNITRAQFAAMLSKLFPTESGEISFSDVSPNHWAYAAIQNAVAKGWVSGYPDGTFAPDAPITRAEAFAMINNMLGRSPDKDLIDAQGKFLLYLDLPYSHWAYYHIMEAAVPHDHSFDESGKEVWEFYALPTAQLGQGPHVVDGDLYYVGTDGYYVRSQSVGVLDFNDFGCYTTGDVRLDGKLKSIILQETVAGDSLYENLRRMYQYVIDDYRYLAVTHVPQGTSGWENTYAQPMIDRKMGNCYSYAALFTLLARRLGYQATAVSGMVTVDDCPTWTNGVWSEHGWVEIDLGNLTYVCDPQLRDGHAATWGYDWDLFMKPYGQSVAHYRVNDQVLS